MKKEKNDKKLGAQVVSKIEYSKVELRFLVTEL